MNASIARILVKDCRRLGGMALAVVMLYLFSVGIVLHPGRTFGDVTVLDELRWGTILTIALIAVLDDPVPGDRGTWVTRPIAGIELLSAKLIFIVLTLALPSAIIAAVTGVLLHAGVEAVLLASVTLGATTALVALFGAVLGAVTGSLLRAVIVSVSVGVGYGYCARNIDAFTGWLQPRSRLFGLFPAHLSDNSHQAILLVGCVLLALAVLAYQYGQRQSKRAVAIFGSGLILVVLVSAGWPYLDLRSTLRGQNSPPVGLASSRFSLRKPQGELQRIDARSFPLNDEVHLGFQVSRTFGGADADFDYLYLGQSRFTTDDGRVVTMDAPKPFTPFYSTFSNKDRSQALQRRLAKVAELLGSKLIPYVRKEQDQDFTLELLALPRKNYDAVRGVSGHLESWIQTNSYHEDLAGLMPLQAGASLAVKSDLVRIRSFFLLPNGMVNLAVERILFGPARSGHWFDYVLINQATQEISVEDYSMGGARHALAFLAENQSFGPSFSGKYSLVTGKAMGPLNASWLQGAQLGVIEDVATPGPAVYCNWGKVILPIAPAKK